MQSTGTSFGTFLWSNNQVLSKFYYLLIFSPCPKLDEIVATVSCQLLELFKSKKSFKEKVDLENNWKTAWPRMILEWHQFSRLSLGVARKFFCMFLFCFFYLNEEELIMRSKNINQPQNHHF